MQTNLTANTLLNDSHDSQREKGEEIPWANFRGGKRKKGKKKEGGAIRLLSKSHVRARDIYLAKNQQKQVNIP